MRPLDSFRNGAGRFAKGNAGGPGNPHGRHFAQLGRAWLDTMTGEDFQAVVRRLVECAEAGEPWAVKELLDRTIGKPTTAPD